jgi:hypothetical protein
MMIVHLTSRGNPDFGQDPNEEMSETKFVNVTSWKEASEVCQNYIQENNLGGGNWAGGQIYKFILGLSEQVAHVSYNGRVWKGVPRWDTDKLPELLYDTRKETL